MANENMNKAQKAAAMSSSSMALTYHEIFTKVNNAKDKAKKTEILRQHDSVSLRQVLKGAFDPKIQQFHALANARSLLSTKSTLLAPCFRLAFDPRNIACHLF